MEGRIMNPLQIYQADGLRLIVPIVPEPPATLPSLIGGSAEAHVRSSNNVAIAGIATITGPAEVTVVFDPWALPPDDYALQVRAAPPATALRTVLDDQLTVRRSLRPAP
jgi:hypothetical protein